MLKLLFILLFGYQSQDISISCAIDSTHSFYLLEEKFNHKVQGSNRVLSLSLDGKPSHFEGYLKTYEISKAEFYIWYYLLEGESEQKLKQHQIHQLQKEVESNSKTI